MILSLFINIEADPADGIPNVSAILPYRMPSERSATASSFVSGSYLRMAVLYASVLPWPGVLRIPAQRNRFAHASLYDQYFADSFSNLDLHSTHRWAAGKTSRRFTGMGLSQSMHTP